MTDSEQTRRFVLDPECERARTVLEFDRPGEPAETSVDLAREHVARCTACRDALQQQTLFDGRVAGLIRGTRPPAASRERLLAALTPSPRSPLASQPAAMASNHGDAINRRRAPVRRRMLQAVAALALVCLISAAAVLTLRSLPTTELRQLMAVLVSIDWSAERWPVIDRLQDGRKPPLPTTMDTRRISGEARGVMVEQVQAAVFFFQVRRRGTTVHAALVVVPARQLLDSAGAVTFLADRPAQLGELCATSWVEGDVAYVCCVRGNGSDLERLRVPASPAA